MVNSLPILDCRLALVRLAAYAIACVAVLSLISLPLYAEQARRVVTLGGAVTEIVYALGQEDRLVARDSTSSHPPEVLDLPDVGYVRALSPEGVLSVEPDLIVAIEGSGPPETMEVLRAASVPVVTVSEGYDATAIMEKITAVADALGVPDKGTRLAEQVRSELEAAVASGRNDSPPRVLFILSLQGGRILAAGTGTAAEGIISLSGGVNALGGFNGYQQVSEEAVLLAAPDVILMMNRSGSHSINNEDILDHPVLGRTPAAETGAIVRQPGLLLLGFGPRTPEAVTNLSDAFRRARG